MYLDMLIAIVIVIAMNVLTQYGLNKFKNRKEKRYYALYVNDKLVDYKPLHYCEVYYDALEYKGHKGMGIDHKKRIVEIGVDYEIQ